LPTNFDGFAMMVLQGGQTLPPPLCPDPPQIASIDVTNTQCGSTSGAITLNMAGSTSTLTYNWSPNLSSNNVMSDLAAGVYRVTITDTSVTDCAIDTFVIVQNTDGPSVSVTNTSPAVCESANGQASLEPASYNYLWDDLVTTSSRINLSNRTYSVTATDPATNCYSVLTVQVGSINPLVTTVAIVEPATCNESNGTANIDIAGGTGDYSYSWGSMSTNSSLPPGDYQVTVTDNGNGCVDSVAFTMMNANSAGSIELASVTPASCNGGSDGTAVFTTNEGFPFGEPSSILIKDFNGLPKVNGFLSAGSYTAYFLDAGGCIVDSSFVQMTENTSLNAVPNVIAQTCTVGGIISLDVTGGVPPYTYDWADLAGTDDPKDRTDLVAGNYSVTVHDDLGCQFVLGAINVGNECGMGGCTNPVIITDVVVGQSDCGLFNGSAKVLINGNPADYDWAWSPSSGVLIDPGNERQSLGLGTYSVTITDKLNNACFTSRSFAVTNSNGPQATVESTTPVACNSMNGGAVLVPANLTYTWSDGSHLTERNDLADGYHFVTVTDGSCENIVTVYIEDTKTLDAHAVINQEPTCGMSDGSVTIEVGSGSGSYSYDWGAGATHNGLAAGNYEVLVADLQTGCDTVLSFVLNNQIPGASVTINGPVFTSCAGSHDGMVDFDVDYFSGFAQPATIEIWNHADSVVTNGELYVGPHCVVVKDANGCIAGQNCFFVNSPLALNVFSSVIPVSCSDSGSIDITVTGGEGGYTYDWADLPGMADPEDRMGLSSGTYSVTITDGHGCSAAQDVINVANICGCDAFAGTLTVDSTNICDQKPNMLISATPDGNAFIPTGYEVGYFLTKESDHILLKMSGTPVISVAGSGTFVIHTFIYSPLEFDFSTIEYGTTTIFDVNNQLIQGGGLICASLDVAGAAVLVNKCTVCNMPMPTASVTDAHCGVMDGSIALQFSQDTTGFTYKWSPNLGDSATLSGIEAGAYYVTVSEYGDATCAVSKTIVVTNVDGPVVTIDSIAPTICTSANGFIRLSPPTLDYLWENGSESYVRSGLIDTVYAIKATDSTGCFSMLAVDIDQEDPLETSLEILSQPVCGLANGHVKVEVTGGSDHYSYSWGNFAEKQDLLPGNYTVVVVDMEYGCHDVLPFTMTNEDKNLIAADSLFLESGNCDEAYPICLDLPASNAFGYVYTDNGLAYTGNIVACGADTIYYYEADMFLTGSYSVAGMFNGVNHSAIITSQEQMLDSLKSWDPFSGWILKDNRLVALNPSGTYEDLFLTDTNTGIIAFLSVQIDAVEQGVELKFDIGSHDIFVKENATGCIDTLFAKIDCITCPTIYSGGDTIFGGICGVDTGFLCLDIPTSEIAHYTIRDNWTPYTGLMSSCANNKTQLALTQGGHTLIVTNNETYCVDTLQLYVYCVPPPDFVIDTFLYEKEHIEICMDNSILTGIPIFSQEMCQVIGTPKVTNSMDFNTFCVDIGGLTLGRDTLCIQVCDNQGACAMTYIYVDILPRMDTMETFVTLTTTDTFCLDTTLFAGDIATVENLCPGLSGSIIDAQILGLTGCVEVTGMNIGVDTICLAVCDSYNYCDTTVLLVESDVPKPDTMDIEMVIYGDTVVCVDFSDLPRPVESFEVICQDAPGKAIFQISPSSYCVEIHGYDYGRDSLCLAFCDDQFCDTLVLAVNIIEDSLALPVANDDHVMVILNRSLDFYPLENDLVNGTVDTITISQPPNHGSVVINSDYSFTYTPDINTCLVQDSFIYDLKNKNGTDNAVVYLELLCDEVTVYSALSPNGDGLNDFLYIEGIDNYPNNEVFVFNRWGNEVFHRNGYSNSEPWDGMWSDTHLPVGTYYYVIVLGNGSMKKYRGYIQIER
ncbi:MAG TPA: T9SS type B sorting domain-containing protein, partial [Saprospiraceae bacterium]|nr:T9SS type B sorting domain-containing protein [Saprospiraceae bacterium]